MKKENGFKFKRPVQCITTKQVFDSVREAANWCGLVGVSGICSVCNNQKQKTAGVHPISHEKLTWRYIDIDEYKKIKGGDV